MSKLVSSLLILVCLLTVAGCGAQVPQEELGTVEFRVPHVPGSEEPYPLNQLKEVEAVD